MKDDRDSGRAIELFQEAYRRQVEGKLDEAIDLYLQSLEAYPAAEAHTFLGWAYSFQGRFDEAIVECQNAIEIDPEFGNPYNDIGVYLIEKDQYDEAFRGLKKPSNPGAMNYRFPHYNGSSLFKQRLAETGAAQFEALKIAPDYSLAQDAADATEDKSTEGDPHDSNGKRRLSPARHAGWGSSAPSRSVGCNVIAHFNQSQEDAESLQRKQVAGFSGRFSRSQLYIADVLLRKPAMFKS
jgi:tetratricopeptide (TPR) repeat protein